MFDADLLDMHAVLGEPVTPAAGAVFHGIFNAADVDPIGAPSIVGDYVLRYPIASATLAVGDVLAIRGAQYRVVADPYRIEDGREAVVQLRQGSA